VHLSWVAIVLLIVGWWGTLLHTQAGRIAELEGRLGSSPQHVVESQLRSRRMIIWESSSLLLLLLALGGAGAWLLARDSRRTRELEAFFASITHELKTPLTSIRLQAEALADSPKIDAAQKPLIRRLLEDTGRLEAQVERTLELARLEGGGPVFLHDIPLESFLENALRPFKEFQGERLTVETQVPAGLRVKADPTGLEVILRNTVENSLRHSARDRVRLKIRAERAADGVSVTLSDDGTDFSGDPRRLGKLFAKGARSKGTGIGLYLVSTLMTRMGGEARFTGGAQGFETRLWFREGQA
jgi:signal transduction histidine kinase